MNLENDTRYKILKHLHEIGHTTEQVSINSFLANLKTYNDSEDIGTIRRSCEELENNEYILQSKNRSSKPFREAMSTMGTCKELKTPLRFIQDIDFIDPDREFSNNKKIEELYFYVTLKGKRFIFDWEKSMKDDKNVRRKNFWFPIILIIGLLGGASGIITTVYSIINTPNKDSLQQSQSLLKETEDSKTNSVEAIQVYDTLE